MTTQTPSVIHFTNNNPYAKQTNKQTNWFNELADSNYRLSGNDGQPLPLCGKAIHEVTSEGGAIQGEVNKGVIVIAPLPANESSLCVCLHC